MEGKKLYREKDVEFICKSCNKKTSIGFNILQGESFEKYRDECIKESLCPKCLMQSRINAMIEFDPVLIDTAKNMIAVGII